MFLAAPLLLPVMALLYFNPLDMVDFLPARLPVLVLLFAVVRIGGDGGGGASAQPSYHSEKTFQVSPRIREAYAQILDLRLGEARKTVAEIKLTEPRNLLVFLLDDYLDFFTILLNDNRTEYKHLLKNRDLRLVQIARGPRKSPWYLYAQAEIRLHWAVLQGRFGANLAALNDVKQAYALLEQNRHEHPDFRANDKSLGVLHALVGNIPDEYRWAIRLLSGMQGSIRQGLDELEMLLEYSRAHDFLFETETRAACAFLQLHLENSSVAAWATISSGALDARKSPLAAYALAGIAMRTGRNDVAVRLLEACPDGAPYHPFAYRHYLLGIAKLNRLDSDADKPLQKFLQAFKGRTGIKETCQKLAWHQLLAGNTDGYRRYMELVKTRGVARAEPDKAALREADRGEVPDTLLLKTRLLFDGGYYRRAYDFLQAAKAKYTSHPKHSLEYHYRLGRIADALGKTEEAVQQYRQTVRDGAAEPAYFACNAALQLGLLYEKQGAGKAARNAFKQCLALKPESYAASLHARAKAGLSRLRE